MMDWLDIAGGHQLGVWCLDEDAPKLSLWGSMRPLRGLKSIKRVQGTRINEVKRSIRCITLRAVMKCISFINCYQQLRNWPADTAFFCFFDGKLPHSTIFSF